MESSTSPMCTPSPVFWRSLSGLVILLIWGADLAQKLIDTSRRYSLLPIGLDYGANLVHCRNSYREGQWIEADFENPDRNLLGPDVLEQAVIICSDLIEHLRDPNFSGVAAQRMVAIRPFWDDFNSRTGRALGCQTQWPPARIGIMSGSGTQRSWIVILRKAA